MKKLFRKWDILMGRERDRIAKRMEKNQRYSSYIDYNSRVMLGAVYYKGIAGISSIHRMTRESNNEKIVKKSIQFQGSRRKRVSATWSHSK